MKIGFPNPKKYRNERGINDILYFLYISKSDLKEVTHLNYILCIVSFIYGIVIGMIL